jgi:hypothetical protein
MRKYRAIKKGLCMLTLGGALAGAMAGTAFATTVTPTAAPTATTSTTGLQSSLGIWFYNNSSDNLVLQSVTGDNEGAPTVGSTLVSGNGHQDFEVTFRAAKSTTVTATYGIQDDTGATVGTAVVKFSDSALGSASGSASFTAPNGTKLPFTMPYYYNAPSNAYQMEDASSTTTQVNATDPLANTLLEQYCNNSNNSAVCTFKPSSHLSTTQEQLLESGYTEPGGGNQPSTISVSSGYDDQTAINTGTAVTATMKLGSVLSIAISQAYNQTLAWDQTFSASESIAVNPSYTGYIWGQVPVIQYAGTMDIVVGNTTWDISNTVISSPDPSRSLSSFQTGTWLGYYPIGKPSQPPSS